MKADRHVPGGTEDFPVAILATTISFYAKAATLATIRATRTNKGIFEHSKDSIQWPLLD